ncbi:MAG: hypothetical protein Q8K89_05745, partial [Actinomycetota bacterium]|nr:hypothetical protein [Actinomycetota bacterium]
MLWAVVPMWACVALRWRCVRPSSTVPESRTPLRVRHATVTRTKELPVALSIGIVGLPNVGKS